MDIQTEKRTHTTTVTVEKKALVVSFDMTPDEVTEALHEWVINHHINASPTLCALKELDHSTRPDMRFDEYLGHIVEIILEDPDQ